MACRGPPSRVALVAFLVVPPSPRAACPLEVLVAMALAMDILLWAVPRALLVLLARGALHMRA